MKDFTREIFFRTARSGGKGGQNVNKVETMAEAWWHVTTSVCLTPDEKALVLTRLENRINKDGYLVMRASDTRSQLENKQIAMERLKELVLKSLVVPKKRKATRPSQATIEKRLDAKRRQSERKQMRRSGFE